MFKGYTVSYRGKKYSSNQKDQDKSKNGFDKLVELFSEIGALTIRYHIGQGQRVGLLQQISREDYTENPVEKPAQGNNQTDLFEISSTASSVTAATRELEKISHHSLGRGKVLNERAQPLVHVNTTGLRGEEAIWDIIHSPVWGTGINLSHQLTKQGFLYVCSDANFTELQRQHIKQDLENGAFEITPETNAQSLIKTKSGYELKTARISSLQIGLDPELAKITQSNGFTISAPDENTAAPFGWIINPTTKNKTLIDQEDAENLIRIIRIAKGGFYELTPEQQKLLQSSLLKNNGFGLFTQNQAFNAMHVILEKLAKDFGFDPSLLISTSLSTSYNRMQKLFKESNIAAEDFLTGILITEMVQPLMVTQANSTRTKLPLRFNNPFKVTLNNAKAIAYAYDLAKEDGSTLVQISAQQAPLSIDNELIDVRINGELQNPDLNSPKHVAALLSTAVLVAEQIMVEQLLRSACVDENHPNSLALKSILVMSDPVNGEATLQQLIELASTLPKNEQGPILGLQFSYCDEIVKLLRQALNHDALIKIITSLYQFEGDIHAFFKKMKVVLDMNKSVFSNLFNTGALFQELQTVSVKSQQSRGINAGLIPVLEKLEPALYNQLISDGKIDKQNISNSNSPIKSEEKTEEQWFWYRMSSADVCPFFRTMRSETKQSLVVKNDQVNPKINVSSVNSNWCNYFTKRVVPALCVGAAAVTTYMAYGFSE